MDPAPHLLALRGRPVETPLPLRPPDTAVTVSLQTKILVSFLAVGLVLLFAVPVVFERVQGRIAAGAVILGLTLAIGYALTAALARVSRLMRLKASAQEISSGDLSRSAIWRAPKRSRAPRTRTIRSHSLRPPSSPPYSGRRSATPRRPR